MRAWLVKSAPVVMSVLTLALLTPSGTRGQQAAPAERSQGAVDQVLEVRMHARPAVPREGLNSYSDGDYDVVLSYNVRLGPTPVTLTALGFDGVALQGISVRLDGEIVTGLGWTRTNPTGAPTQMWTGTLTARGSASARALELHYTVMGALQSSGELVLPVVTLSAEPPPALPGAFEAQIELPDGKDGSGMHVRQAFPADVTGGTGPEDPTIVASLAVLPRSLRFRLGPGVARPWARVSLLEAIATFLIILFGLMGWRHLVKSA